MSWIGANLAPLMFGGMVLFMLVGYPAAFSLAATGLFFGFIGIEYGLIRPDFLGNLTFQLFGIISNDLLLAIPFFTFMGAILERCGLAEDLLDSIGQLFGPVRGGLSYAVIFVGAILGAITGTVAASVIAMGVISMTPMLKYGYSTRHTMGVIAASGTITQLIPPSLVLVVLADQLKLDKDQGLVIVEVAADSVAAKAGLKANDVLVELNGNDPTGSPGRAPAPGHPHRDPHPPGGQAVSG